MSFSTPFCDFFDAITNEVNSFNRLLDDSGYRTYKPSEQQLLGQKEGKDKQVANSKTSTQLSVPRRSPLTYLDGWSSLTSNFGGYDLIPPVDILEHNDNFVVTVTVPGVKEKKDIDIEYHKERNQIVISGEISSSYTSETKDKVKVQERSSGKFSRVITLPDYPGIDADNIKADYSSGVLTLTIPKLKPSTEGNNAVHKIQISSKDSWND